MQVQRKPKAIVKLDIGTKEEEIHIYEGDDLSYLVSYFCERHDLGKDCYDYVMQEVQRQNRNQSALDCLVTPPTLRSKIEAKLLEHHYDMIQKNKHKKNSSIYDKLYSEHFEQQYQKDEKTFNRMYGDERAIQEIPFKPSVSPSNDLIVSKLKRNQTQMSITDYLYEEGANKRARQQYAVESRLKEIDEQRKPQIRSPKHTNKLRKSRSLLNVHDRLYREAQNKRMPDMKSKEKWNKDHPFRPQRSRSPIRPRGQNEDTCLKHKDRDKPKDEVRQFPLVDHDMYYQRAARKRDVEDRMIADQIRTGKLKIKTKSKSPKTTNYNIVKSKTYDNNDWVIAEKIFRALDSDNDGYISDQKINIVGVKHKVLSCIACVLLEMEEKKKPVDLPRFYSMCAENRLFQQLSQLTYTELSPIGQKQFESTFRN